MGVTFCVLFTWWFVSGIVIMYWDYPEVSAADRLQRAQPLNAARIGIPLQAAYANLHEDRRPRAVLLAMFDGRPVYRFRFAPDDERAIYADDGSELTEFPPALLLRVAAAWTGRPARQARFEGTLTAGDQWTVSGEFTALRPLQKYAWPDGEEVYVSEVTGAVEQYTTRASRLGAYFGAIPHWLYFTPLRTHGLMWSRIVIAASALATVAAFFGLAVGIWMYAPSRRVPYSGQKRLHMIFGLFFGVIACTWSFSGMLSMDPFPTSDEPGASDAEIARALRGRLPALADFAVKPPWEALREIESLPVKELNFTSFDGQPAYLAIAGPRTSRIVPISGPPQTAFDPDRILGLLQRAIRPAHVTASRLLTTYDAYYLDRNGNLPLPVLRVRLDDEGDSQVYIDPRTARVVGRYSTRDWATRWLYHGLHSLNFPWLYQHRPAWDLVVICLLAGGTALSVTSVIIAGPLLRRKIG